LAKQTEKQKALRYDKKWCIPVTEKLDELVEKAVKLDAHVSKADFVRDAVRRMLEKMGLYPLLQNDEK